MKIASRANTAPDVARPLAPSLPAPIVDHMRVVVFSDAIPGRNGVGTFYDDLAYSLEPYLGAIRVIAPPEEPEAGEAGWSIRMPGDPTQRVHIPWIPQLWKQVRWTRPHVILAATPSLYGVTGLLLASRLKAGAALCYHTEFPKLADTYWTGVRKRIMPAFLSWWDRLLVRYSPAVLAPNEELATVLAGKGRTDARVMYTLAPKTFVDTPPPEPPTAVRKVTFIGRLAPEKRIEQVLRAAQALPEIRFRLIGDGPLRELAQTVATDCPNLELLGWRDRADVMREIDATDLVVLPSRHETFGTAAFEAMVRGRPALVSPECGITGWPELADGIFVMRADESLTPALRRVTRLPEAELAAHAREARRASVLVHQQAVAGWLELLGSLARDPAR